MSIINDALRKADRQKKWKTFSKLVLADNSIAVAPPQAPLPVREKLKAPVPLPGAPPFRIRFDQPEEQPKSPPATSTFKVVWVTFFIACVAVLILGAFIYVWTGQGFQWQAIQAPPSPPIQSQPVVTKPKVVTPAFKPYQSPSAVQTTVRPVPLSLKQPPIESHYHLTGISVLPDANKIAIINGKVLSAGQTIDGAQLTEIKDNMVKLKKDNREFALSII